MWYVPDYYRGLPAAPSAPSSVDDHPRATEGRRPNASVLSLPRPVTHARPPLDPTQRATRGMTGRPPAARYFPPFPNPTVIQPCPACPSHRSATPVWDESACRRRRGSTTFYVALSSLMMRRTHPGHPGCVPHPRPRTRAHDSPTGLSTTGRFDGTQRWVAHTPDGAWTVHTRIRSRANQVRRVYAPRCRSFRSEENVRIPPLRSAVRRNLMLALVVR